MKKRILSFVSVLIILASIIVPAFAEGKEKLAEQSGVLSFEGEIDTSNYKYKEDYDVGDIVTVKNQYGITTNARITEVIETWDNTGSCRASCSHKIISGSRSCRP